VKQHVRPERPDNCEAPQLTDEVWQLVERCWVSDPRKRPISDTICDDIRSMLDGRQSSEPTSLEPEAREPNPGHQHPNNGEGRERVQDPLNGLLDSSMSASLLTTSQLQLILSPETSPARSSGSASARDEQPAPQEVTHSSPSTSARLFIDDLTAIRPGPIPDTPEPSFSELTESPASSVSRQTPVGMIDDTVQIISHESYPGLSIVEQAALDFAVMKRKMFAFTAPSEW
jgi:hypothetical protein